MLKLSPVINVPSAIAICLRYIIFILITRMSKLDYNQLVLPTAKNNTIICELDLQSKRL